VNQALIEKEKPKAETVLSAPEMTDARMLTKLNGTVI